ncbi:MAG TPA: hypothetical protein VFU13_13885 [Steroidobacteraceae bacterium]|nr:hypothetical protein [Steroidobacteraceae bacterium]
MQRSTVFLLVVALASTGVSAGLWMQLRAERALNAELVERLSVAAANRITPQPVASPAAEPPTVIAPVAVTPASTRTSASTSSSNATELAFPRPARGAQQHDWQARQRKLMSDPKYREAFREQERLRLTTRRENFIRLLGFSPEQADAVIGLSIDSQMQMQEGTGNPADYQARLREMLGEEKFAQLNTYMESRQTRMQVDEFRMQLTGADVLRDDQLEPLIAALHVERSQVQRDLEEYARNLNQESDPSGTRRNFMERETELLKEAHVRMSSSAAAILSSAQLRKLEAMLKRDIERRETHLRMSRIKSKLEPPLDVALGGPD